MTNIDENCSPAPNENLESSDLLQEFRDYCKQRRDEDSQIKSDINKIRDDVQILKIQMETMIKLLSGIIDVRVCRCSNRNYTLDERYATCPSQYDNYTPNFSSPPQNSECHTSANTTSNNPCHEILVEESCDSISLAEPNIDNIDKHSVDRRFPQMNQIHDQSFPSILTEPPHTNFSAGNYKRSLMNQYEGGDFRKENIISDLPAINNLLTNKWDFQSDCDIPGGAFSNESSKRRNSSWENLISGSSGVAIMGQTIALTSEFHNLQLKIDLFSLKERNCSIGLFVLDNCHNQKITLPIKLRLYARIQKLNKAYVEFHQTFTIAGLSSDKRQPVNFSFPIIEDISISERPNIIFQFEKI